MLALFSSGRIHCAAFGLPKGSHRHDEDPFGSQSRRQFAKHGAFLSACFLFCCCMLFSGCFFVCLSFLRLRLLVSLWLTSRWFAERLDTNNDRIGLWTRGYRETTRCSWSESRSTEHGGYTLRGCALRRHGM